MSQERPIRLHAGPWSLEFERWSGWVRCVRLGGQEVVRAVYAVARGENWATYSQRVVHNHVSQEDGRFQAAWRVELDELAYVWEGSAVCDGSTLQIEWSGESGQGFRTRRTGVCVLHPQEVKGLPCSVTHTDGQVEEGKFPTLVEPHQPFFDIRSIAHKVGDANLNIEFQGEVFEMEDQRNWTDASFKTYCRPQEWPQPYEIASGERLRHGIQLSYEGVVEKKDQACRTVLTSLNRKVPMPKLGTQAGSPVSEFDFVLDPSDPGAAWSAIGWGRVYAVGSFVDLNRSRPEFSEWDGVAFGAHPQVHAFDERSIMENSQGLADPVRTAKEFSGGGAVYVGPLMFQSSSTSPDGRMDREMGPAWLLASLANLAEAGADAVCFLDQGSFSHRIRKTLELVAGATEIGLVASDNPYRAIAFQVGGKTILVNMRPYATSVHFREDLELEPYEVRVL